MSHLKWIFLVGCTLMLTACPNNDKASDKRDLQKFTGIWIRDVDFCDYYSWNYPQADSRCYDIDTDYNNSTMANDNNWQTIVINADGGINSYTDYYEAQNNGSWSLGLLSSDGHYTGYLTTMNSSGRPRLIRFISDAEGMVAWTERGRSKSRVGFVRVTEQEAQDFNYGYNNCNGGYCKGNNWKNARNKKGRRYRRHIRNNDNRGRQIIQQDESQDDDDNNHNDDRHLTRQEQFQQQQACIDAGNRAEECETVEVD